MPTESGVFEMAAATKDSTPLSPQAPLTAFTLFPKLPVEIRLMIWKLSLPGPRIVHLKQKRLKEPAGEWWERVRSDVAMWPCDKPFEQDGLAPWEKDDWDAKFGWEYHGDDVFDDLAEVERLDKETEEEEDAFKKRWELPDDRKRKHILETLARRKEQIRRVRGGETRVDVLRELMRNYPSEVFEASPEDEYDYLDLEGVTNRDSEYGIDDDSDAGSQHDSMFGDGDDRPKQLWGFSTEFPGDPIPTLLLACRESRGVVLESYQPLFSSPGAMPEIYFDHFRDTLFIDHETFLQTCRDWLQETCFPVTELREMAIRDVSPLPIISEVTDICEHLTYGPRTRNGQRYVDLKRTETCQDGKSFDEDSEPNGTFYMKGLRIDRSFIDWDNIIDRHIFSSCMCREEQLWNLWDEWEDANPNSTRPKIRFDWADLIPAADERLLLHHAAILEKQHNQGQ
ncbi:uncharacterized protein PAC_08536 [Phialocephala subalpina]|uniref:2EXR domain-containing protein n=1 Tax=Phialocephala subalpina TaxID=576137 RepID=A0A1L7X0U3_9HELO|nr:uncharacterized protein PAC_08536 [Phialocephala subalpina]